MYKCNCILPELGATLQLCCNPGFSVVSTVPDRTNTDFPDVEQDHRYLCAGFLRVQEATDRLRHRLWFADHVLCHIMRL